MKKLSLKNAKSMLSRKEMKVINGGSYGSCNGCCAQTSGYMTACGLSSSQARQYAGSGGSWCCDSCGSASWLPC